MTGNTQTTHLALRGDTPLTVAFPQLTKNMAALQPLDCDRQLATVITTCLGYAMLYIAHPNVHTGDRMRTYRY